MTATEMVTTCRVIHATEHYEGKQGASYAAGVSAQSVGAQGIWLGTVAIAPGGRTKAHLHEGHETAFYVLSGEVSMYDGTGWKTGRPGDFFFVPEGGLHGFRGANHSSMLLMFSPGAPREGYFETLAGLAEHPMTAEQRVEFMLRHDTYWV